MIVGIRRRARALRGVIGHEQLVPNRMVRTACLTQQLAVPGLYQGVAGRGEVVKA